MAAKLEILLAKQARAMQTRQPRAYDDYVVLFHLSRNRGKVLYYAKSKDKKRGLPAAHLFD